MAMLFVLEDVSAGRLGIAAPGILFRKGQTVDGSRLLPGVEDTLLEMRWAQEVAEVVVVLEPNPFVAVSFVPQAEEAHARTPETPKETFLQKIGRRAARNKRRRGGAENKSR